MSDSTADRKLTGHLISRVIDPGCECGAILLDNGILYFHTRSREILTFITDGATVVLPLESGLVGFIISLDL